METPSKWRFLTSPRFWQLFIVGVTAGLNDYAAHGRWIQALTIAIGIWLGGSTVVRTVDRITEPPLKPE